MDTITALIAPSEPSKAADELSAITSILCEQHGADYLIYSKAGIWGGQRKNVPHDFISSMTDGRMARETTLLQDLAFPEVICEGPFEYYHDGTLVTSPKVPVKYNKVQIEGMKLDIRLVKGIPIVFTEDLDDTIAYIKLVEKFLSGEKHIGLFRRPKAKGAWGIPSGSEEASWVLQGLPGMGVGLADNVLQHYGRLPIKWDTTYEELLRVPKIGVSRAKKLWSALGGLYD